jgi:hypothetical protein
MNHTYIIERPGCREECLIFNNNARKLRALVTFHVWSPQGFLGCSHRGNIKTSTGGCVTKVVKRSPAYIAHTLQAKWCPHFSRRLPEEPGTPVDGWLQSKNSQQAGSGAPSSDPQVDPFCQHNIHMVLDPGHLGR